VSLAAPARITPGRQSFWMQTKKPAAKTAGVYSSRSFVRRRGCQWATQPTTTTVARIIGCSLQ
jgi:hypothetical protein